MCIFSSLTVFFDEPFWVGVYERVNDGKLEASRIVFGSEPKDYEVYEFLMENWKRLKFSPPIDAESIAARKINPKRVQRQVKNQLEQTGVGTKAQQALKLQQEAGKLERRMNSKEQREAKEQYKYQIRQEKKKEKHKGR